MSTLKIKKNSNYYLIKKYEEYLCDYGYKQNPELSIEAGNELADKIALVEKQIGKDIPYPDIIYYLVSFIPAFIIKLNKLTPLYMYSHFVRVEAAKFDLIDEDLFYTRKYLEKQDLYSEEVNGHVSAILDYVKEKSSKQKDEYQYYYYLGLLLKEYMLLNKDFMKKALIYKMYDFCFDRVKMISLYMPVKTKDTGGASITNFPSPGYDHRGWLTNFKVEKE
jgi:hypothetical protein